MAENVTNELMFEILKQLQKDMADVKSTLADHTRQFIRVREDINGLRGDDLRREAMQANMAERLQRIENRLNLTDA
ncbi:MAG: hypothetical protein ACOY15_13650 [Pseudomonadota bacterium]